MNLLTEYALRNRDRVGRFRTQTLLLTKIIILLAACVAGQGCATTATLGGASPKNHALVMSGTQMNIALIERGDAALESHQRAGMPRYPWLDLPFSFALDTMLLAFTIPTAVVSYVVRNIE